MSTVNKLAIQQRVMSGESFAGRVLVGMDLTEVDLSNANFRGANLIGANFAGSKLNGANFQECQVIGADFTACDAANANFRNVNMRHCKMDGMNLRGANMAYADLRDQDLSDVDLGKANLTRAILARAKMRNANLEEANLSRCEAQDANFTNARMVCVRLERAVCSGARLEKASLMGASLRHVDLMQAVLSEAVLIGADLEGAYMKRADCAKASFLGANLAAVILSEGNLSRANLQRANLTAANLQRSNLEGTNLTEAILKNGFFTGCNFGKARLTNVDARGAEMRECNLNGVDLSRSNMATANLEHSTLVFSQAPEVNFENAKLSQCDLSGCNFEGANLVETMMNSATLEGASFKDATFRRTNFLHNTVQSLDLSPEQLAGIVIDEELENITIGGPEVQSGASLNELEERNRSLAQRLELLSDKKSALEQIDRNLPEGVQEDADVEALEESQKDYHRKLKAVIKKRRAAEQELQQIQAQMDEKKAGLEELVSDKHAAEDNLKSMKDKGSHSGHNLVVKQFSTMEKAELAAREDLVQLEIKAQEVSRSLARLTQMKEKLTLEIRNLQAQIEKATDLNTRRDYSQKRREEVESEVVRTRESLDRLQEIRRKVAKSSGKIATIEDHFEQDLLTIEAALSVAPTPQGADLSIMLKMMALADIIQQMHMNRKTGMLTMVQGKNKGCTYLQNGDIVHATHGTLTGKAAFFEMLAMSEGMLHFTEEVPTVERSIPEAAPFLLLEAMRQFDERRRSAT